MKKNNAEFLLTRTEPPELIRPDSEIFQRPSLGREMPRLGKGSQDLRHLWAERGQDLGFSGQRRTQVLGFSEQS